MPVAQLQHANAECSMQLAALKSLLNLTAAPSDRHSVSGTAALSESWEHAVLAKSGI